MKYPRKEKKEFIKKNRVYVLHELGKIYDAASSIEEYKVNRDLKMLKCPSLVDAFVIYYLAKNYGKDFVCTGIPILLGLAISTVIGLIMHFCIIQLCTASIVSSCVLWLACSAPMSWYLQHLYGIGYRYTS